MRTTYFLNALAMARNIGFMLVTLFVITNCDRHESPKSPKHLGNPINAIKEKTVSNIAVTMCPRAQPGKEVRFDSIGRIQFGPGGTLIINIDKSEHAKLQDFTRRMAQHQQEVLVSINTIGLGAIRVMEEIQGGTISFNLSEPKRIARAFVKNGIAYHGIPEAPDPVPISNDPDDAIRWLLDPVLNPK